MPRRPLAPLASGHRMTLGPTRGSPGGDAGHTPRDTGPSLKSHQEPHPFLSLVLPSPLQTGLTQNPVPRAADSELPTSLSKTRVRPARPSVGTLVQHFWSPGHVTAGAEGVPNRPSGGVHPPGAVSSWLGWGKAHACWGLHPWTEGRGVGWGRVNSTKGDSPETRAKRPPTAGLTEGYLKEWLFPVSVSGPHRRLPTPPRAAGHSGELLKGLKWKQWTRGQVPSRAPPAEPDPQATPISLAIPTFVWACGLFFKRGASL